MTLSCLAVLAKVCGLLIVICMAIFSFSSSNEQNNGAGGQFFISLLLTG